MRQICLQTPEWIFWWLTHSISLLQFHWHSSGPQTRQDLPISQFWSDRSDSDNLIVRLEPFDYALKYQYNDFTLLTSTTDIQIWSLLLMSGMTLCDCASHIIFQCSNIQRFLSRGLRGTWSNRRKSDGWQPCCRSSCVESGVWLEPSR